MIKYKILILSFLLLSGCNTISSYNQKAYENATSVKAQSLIVMDKAIEPYESHKDDVDKLNLEIQKAYEYSKGQPKNKNSTDQWEIIRNPRGASMGNFLIFWKNKQTLGDIYIEEKKEIISKHFDTIIKLEESKTK